jgi:hypothetical protein
MAGPLLQDCPPVDAILAFFTRDVCEWNAGSRDREDIAQMTL